MNQFKKRLIQNKRYRPSSQSQSDSNTNQRYEISSEESLYYISLKILYKEKKLLIVCSPKNNSLKYEASFELDNLKEKNIIFTVCKDLQDAFKIIINLLEKKKGKISEESNDVINLLLLIPNYIENNEDTICFNLTKVKNEINTELISEDITMKNDYNLSLDLIQRINELSKSNIEKEAKIEKLIIHFNQFLEELKGIKGEIKKIKKYIRISNNDNDGNDKDDNEEEEEEEINEKQDKESLKEEKNSENINEEEESKNKGENKQSKINIVLSSINTTPKKKSKTQIKIKIPNNNTKNICPQLSFYKNLTKKTNSIYQGDNNFAVFETINKEIFLVYSGKNCSIFFYDIDQDNLIKTISQAHSQQITNFRYARDKNNSRDLVLSISDKNKNIKIWEVKTFSCILNLENVYFDGFLFSSCFLIEEIIKKSYIITINFSNEPIKIFNFKGAIVKSIDNREDHTYIVDSYYNSFQKRYYIITGNENFIISYNFEDGKIYNKYCDYSSASCLHMFFEITLKDTESSLIETDLLGFVRIWNFDTGSMIKKYLVGKDLKLRGICLWSEKYIFVGANDKKVKLIDLNNGKVLDELKCNEIPCTIKKINSYKFGECLLFMGKSYNGQIKMWRTIS